MTNTLITIDIGGTTIKYALWKEKRLYDIKSLETPRNYTDFLQAMTFIKNTFKSQIDGIAISLPGIVNEKEGTVHAISVISFLNNHPIKKDISAIFDDLPCTFENDAYCAALAELDEGIAKDYTHAVFLILGTGIGGAYAVNNQIIRGNNGFAGEFGCAFIDSSNFFSRQSSPVNVVNRYKKNHQSPANFNGIDLFKLADRHYPPAVKAVNSLVSDMGRAIYNILVSFDPEIVVVGGGISQNEQFIQMLNLKVREYLDNYPIPNFQFELKAAKFNNSANLVGAVMHWNRCLNNQ